MRTSRYDAFGIIAENQSQRKTFAVPMVR